MLLLQVSHASCLRSTPAASLLERVEEDAYVEGLCGAALAAVSAAAAAGAFLSATRKMLSIHLKRDLRPS